jgi:hypothetical protein
MTFPKELEMIRAFLFLLIFSLTAASTALAMPAINCHCFQDRAFDPAKPSAADQYYLATTQNRLLAAVFDQPRRNRPQPLWSPCSKQP